ncbi:MAG: D-glycero-beta-D-manno-heptose 1,7-bisphosphate 7-phosphatase [Gammaproteobacteria bacterium]
MKLIILDRDGVINVDSPDYIKSPDEWLPLPRSLTAIARLYQAGYTLAVATNQSGVGRGYYSLATLAKMHEKMQQAVIAAGGFIDAIFFCPHTPEEGCDCRKPKPGLFHQIAAYYQLDLQGVIAIGDSPRDIEAAEQVGCRAIRVSSQHPDLLSIVDELL